MLAKRLKDFDSSAIQNAFRLAAEIPDPIDLSIGYPEDDTPDYIKAAAIRAIKNGFTRYTASNGTFELREAIAEKLRRENKIMLTPDDVSVTPGVTTGILLTYLALLDPGDEILIPDPYFPPYRDLAIMLGAKPVYVDTYPSFQLTADLIRPHITRRTKALLINSPNNPSGAVYAKKQLKEIAKLAKEHDLIIISDEIYEHFAYDESHFSIGSIYPKTVTLNGFSKAYAMTGWRIGYIAGPPQIISAINELQQYAVFSSSSIGQKAAMAAFRHSSDILTAKYRSKRDLTRELLKGQFDLQAAQGAFYAYVPVPAGYDDLSFVELAASHGVIVLPSRAFSQHHNYVRIAFAAKRKPLAKGLKLLCKLAVQEAVNIPAKPVKSFPSLLRKALRDRAV